MSGLRLDLFPDFRFASFSPGPNCRFCRVGDTVDADSRGFALAMAHAKERSEHHWKFLDELGDFNFDGTLSADDLDALAAQVRNGELVALYDLDENDALELANHRAWETQQKKGPGMGTPNWMANSTAAIYRKSLPPAGTKRGKLPAGAMAIGIVTGTSGQAIVSQH